MVSMMLSLASLALLAALVVGLPAIWLVRSQLENQTWDQVRQGQQATAALYEAHLSELASLATLTAERPTLATLLGEADQAALLAYLDVLREGADVDFIAVCTGGRPVAQAARVADAVLLPPLCDRPVGHAVLTTPPGSGLPQVWLAGVQRLTAPTAAQPATVIVARRLASAQMEALSRQTGLEQTLLIGDLPVASSLPGDPAQMRRQEAAAAPSDDQVRFTWDGRPFYAARLPLTATTDPAPVYAEVALSVAEVRATEQRLLRLLVSSIALATLLGLALAFLMARRISRPLADLTRAATTMRRGDLSSPIAFDASVREVALVGQALEAARADLQRTLADLRREKALTEHFLANVSHEFRTPLTAIAASVELLLDQADTLSRDELRELLTTLYLGVLNLQKLVDNLLESANIEAGRFRVRPRPCSLADIIAEATAIMQPLLDRHNQRLVVELPAAIPVVMADLRRVVQVLVNLLSNASNAQRGQADSEITISAAVEGNIVRVRVADQGPGIAPEQRDALLQGRRFAVPTDADGATEPSGFGLGLSVVKAIVEGHDGQLGIEDRPGGGAVVWFTLRKA